MTRIGDTLLTNFELGPSLAKNGLFILTADGDRLMLSAADLAQLRTLIDEQLPRTPHNHESSDPDAHVLFDSVCCGAQLYRCSALVDGLPSKPIIRHGEDACRSCGESLAQF